MSPPQISIWLQGPYRGLAHSGRERRGREHAPATGRRGEGGTVAVQLLNLVPGEATPQTSISLPVHTTDAPSRGAIGAAGKVDHRPDISCCTVGTGVWARVLDGGTGGRQADRGGDCPADGHGHQSRYHYQ